MEVEAEQVGEVAMIAESIRSQADFELFVAILAFAAVGVCIVSRGGQDERAEAVRNNRTSVGSLGVGLALHHHPPLGRPSVGPIPERTEQALRLASGFMPRGGCFQQRIAVLFFCISLWLQNG